MGPAADDGLVDYDDQLETHVGVILYPYSKFLQQLEIDGELADEAGRDSFREVALALRPPRIYIDATGRPVLFDPEKHRNDHLIMRLAQQTDEWLPVLFCEGTCGMHTVALSAPPPQQSAAAVVVSPAMKSLRRAKDGLSRVDEVKFVDANLWNAQTQSHERVRTIDGADEVDFYHSILQLRTDYFIRRSNSMRAEYLWFVTYDHARNPGVNGRRRYGAYFIDVLEARSDVRLCLMPSMPAWLLALTVHMSKCKPPMPQFVVRQLPQVTRV